MYGVYIYIYIESDIGREGEMERAMRELSIYLFVCLCIYLSISLSLYLSIYRSIDLSIYRSIYLSIYLSIVKDNKPLTNQLLCSEGPQVLSNWHPGMRLWRACHAAHVLHPSTPTRSSICAMTWRADWAAEDSRCPLRDDGQRWGYTKLVECGWWRWWWWWWWCWW